MNHSGEEMEYHKKGQMARHTDGRKKGNRRLRSKEMYHRKQDSHLIGL